MWKFKGIFTKNVVTFINFFLSMNFTTFFLFPLYIKNLGGTRVGHRRHHGSQGISAILANTAFGYLSDLRVPKEDHDPYRHLAGRRQSGIALLTTSLNVPLLCWDPSHPGNKLLLFLHGILPIFVAEIIPQEKRAQGIGMFGVFSLIRTPSAPPWGDYP